MSDQGEVFLRVRFDDDQATRDLDKTVNDAVRKVEGGTTTKRSTKPGARSSSAGVVADELRDLTNNSPAAAKALQAVEGAGIGVSTGALAIGAAVTVAAGAYLKMANAGIDAYVGLATQVRTFSERSGEAAEEASRFVAIADDYGIAANTMSNSLFFLGRAVATNAKGLSDLGVQVVKNKQGGTDLRATLVNVANAYASHNDAAQRAAIVQAALGRQGRELIPVLEKGGAALENLLNTTPSGQILSQEDLDRAREFQLATDNLHDSIQEISIAIGRDLVPELAAMANGLGNAVRWANELLEPIGGLGTVLARLPEALPGIGQLLQGFRLWGQHTKSAASDTDDLTASVDGLNEELDKQYSAQVKALEGELRVVSAHNALEDSYTKIWDATVAYNDALNRTGKYAEDDRKATDRLASSKERLAQANRAVRDATEAVADKQAALTEAEFRFGRQSREAHDAQRDLRDSQEDLDDAHKDVAESTQDVADAQRDLTKALAAGGPTSKEARDAARDLKRAQDDQKEAAFNAAKAEAQLAVDTATAKGETLTAKDEAQLLIDKLNGLATTLAPDSPLRKYLTDTATAITGVAHAAGAMPDLGPLLTPQTGAQLQGPGAVTPGQLGGPGTVGSGGLAGPGGTAAGVSSLSGGPAVVIENLNVANDVDALQVPYDIAWQVGGVR
jgi:hypothetical protein